MNTKRYSSVVFTITIILSILGIILTPDSARAEKMFLLTPERYEDEAGTGFMISDEHKVSTYSYGSGSIGQFRIDGDFKEKTEFNGFTAYNASGDVHFTYNYNGGYQTNEKENWNIKSSSEKSINGCKITRFSKGTLLIQTSKTGNGSDWTSAYEIKDLLTVDSGERLRFYQVSESDFRSGTYYRIMIAYEMQRYNLLDDLIGCAEIPPNPKTHSIFGDLFKPKYSSPINKEFLEVYEFYLGYSNNPVKLRDLYTGKEVSGTQTFSGGFIVDKGGSNYQVKVKRDNQKEQIVEDMTTICEPGSYTITILPNIGDSYELKAKIKNGVTYESASPITYENGKNGKYIIDEEDRVDEDINDEIGLTSLKIAQEAGKSIKRATQPSAESFGMTGSTVQIYLHLHSPQNSDWDFNADNWGHKEKETVDGTYVGTVNTGALLVMKSFDGTNWSVLENEDYSKSLNTSDYSKYYKDKGDVLIYCPNGQDVLKGLYLKIIYAYQLARKDSKDTTRCLETYKIFLCSDNLDAVTFHNLSATENLSNMLENSDDVTAEVYKKSESLQSGSCTVSGFDIDTSLNPIAKYKVYKNGEEIAIPQDKKFVSTGKYEIDLTSAVGSTKNVTIYVDRMDADQAVKNYFGTGFLSGKRVYSDGVYPTYEGGTVEYQVLNPGNQFLPVYGTIKNTKTGNMIQINGKQKEWSGKIQEPGHYIATFQTQPTGSLPGDYRKFTYNFEIIAEGSAPGPVINKRNLTNPEKPNVTDYYPMYYGVTVPSATAGNITVAFASKKSATDYAYNFTKGLVEDQGDGTFRCFGSDTLYEQKIIYNNFWDITQATNFFADQIVKKLYFDLSDPFTYRTLPQEILDDPQFKSEIAVMGTNAEDEKVELTQLKLDKSVTIIQKDERAKLMAMANKALPIISPKRYCYLVYNNYPKNNHNYIRKNFTRDKQGYFSYQFIKVEYDSASVVITDKNGKKYPIGYGVDVGDYLEKHECPSGIIKITEKDREDSDKYKSKQVTYEAVFIRQDENTAVTSISLNTNGGQQTQIFTQESCQTEKTVKAQSFTIKEVKDELDPYTLIAVTHGKTKEYYVADQLPKESFTESGQYTISIINRLGYAYTFKINVG